MMVPNYGRVRRGYVHDRWLAVDDGTDFDSPCQDLMDEQRAVYASAASGTRPRVSPYHRKPQPAASSTRARSAAPTAAEMSNSGSKRSREALPSATPPDVPDDSLLSKASTASTVASPGLAANPGNQEHANQSAHPRVLRLARVPAELNGQRLEICSRTMPGCHPGSAGQFPKVLPLKIHVAGRSSDDDDITRLQVC